MDLPHAPVPKPDEFPLLFAALREDFPFEGAFRAGSSAPPFGTGRRGPPMDGPMALASGHFQSIPLLGLAGPFGAPADGIFLPILFPLKGTGILCGPWDPEGLPLG